VFDGLLFCLHPLNSSKVVFLFFAAASASMFGQNMRFHTNLGDIDVTLRPDVAPQNVGNFLNYVSQGTFTGTIIHRSVPGFVIQGGGYQLSGASPQLAPVNSPVTGEFKISNTRGTIATALSANPSTGTTDPNSGTDQWFFNLADNSATLDVSTNGPFTVFGQVSGCYGLAVMDRIAALPTLNGNPNDPNSPFSTIPLINYSKGTVKASNFVQVTSIVNTPSGTTPVALNAASYNCSGITPATLLTIFGANMGPAQLTGLTISNGVVNTNLAGTRVLFDGTPGNMIYTSANQVSVVAPANVAGKTNVSMVVEFNGVQTAPLVVPVLGVDPAIFSANASGTGDGAIIHAVGALNGVLVSSTHPASVGEIVSLYGQGYGAVTTATTLPDGTIVGSVLPQPTNTISVLIDGTAVTPQYAGGAPGLVNGILQVNFAIPQVDPGSHTIQLQVGGSLSQSGVTIQTQ
jgi:uncharacterized protein (TIGR03437 family)